MAARMKSGTRQAASDAKKMSRMMVPAGGAVGKAASIARTVTKFPKGWEQVEPAGPRETLELLKKPLVKGMKKQISRGMFAPPLDHKKR